MFVVTRASKYYNGPLSEHMATTELPMCMAFSAFSSAVPTEGDPFAETLLDVHLDLMVRLTKVTTPGIPGPDAFSRCQRFQGLAHEDSALSNDQRMAVLERCGAYIQQTDGLHLAQSAVDYAAGPSSRRQSASSSGTVVPLSP